MGTEAAADARTRSNEDWIRDLGDSGLSGDAARRELRIFLVSGLRRAVLSRGASIEMCEDLAQEALVRIRERLESFRGESRFTTWALSIAMRLAFDELRHQRWKDVSLEAFTEDARGPLTFEPSAEASQEKGILRERVLATLREVIENRLTEKQRSVLVAELGGMPHSEIALQLGMKRNALYKLSHDARKRVKSHLEDAGWAGGDVSWVFE